MDDDERSMCSESNASSMFENEMNGESDHEKLEDNLDALYLGATTRHQWQVLVTTLEASKKEHAAKEAQDKKDREIAKSMKRNKKLLKQPKNMVGLKDFLLTIPPQKRHKDLIGLVKDCCLFRGVIVLTIEHIL